WGEDTLFLIFTTFLLLPATTTTRTRGSLRDLERNDEKFERWLHNSVPEPFRPHYVPHPHTRSHFSVGSSSHYSSHDLEYKNNVNAEKVQSQRTFLQETRRRDRAGRRRRNHLVPEPFPPTEQLQTLSKNISTILNSLSQNYDKRVRPNYGGEPVVVGVTMYVLSISSISEVLMDFTLDFYFRQMWKDPRLKFEGTEGISTLSVGSEFLKSIWVPDTFFVNEKTSYFHTATTSNEFLRISKDGDILRSIRLTVTAACNMDLRHFPMDSQLCNIEIESFGYTMSDIRYNWARGATSVVGYRQRAFEISLLTGNYSRLACEIQFSRSMGYYLIQIYIPSSLIVIMSWVSFWLNRNASPARVPLGITTVLTMTTLMSSVNKELPKISYVKSIDIFLGTCFVMVFAALLEYATVGYLAKRIQMRKNHFQTLQKMATELQKEREEQLRVQEEADEAIRLFHMQQQQQQQQLHQRQHHYQTRSMSAMSMTNNSPYPMAQDDEMVAPGYRVKNRAPKERLLGEEDAVLLENTLRKIRVQVNSNQICGIAPSDIDKYSRVMFPVCFVCFNLLYWITYLHISDVDLGDLTLLPPPD
ncbi:Gamma-aminobutyric acid receptor subunit beta, partial [Folsomia candida]